MGYEDCRCKSEWLIICVKRRVAGLKRSELKGRSENSKYEVIEETDELVATIKEWRLIGFGLQSNRCAGGEGLDVSATTRIPA